MLNLNKVKSRLWKVTVVMSHFICSGWVRSQQHNDCIELPCTDGSSSHYQDECVCTVFKYIDYLSFFFLTASTYGLVFTF